MGFTGKPWAAAHAAVSASAAPRTGRTRIFTGGQVYNALMKPRRWFASLSLVLFSGTALAQAFPSRNVTLGAYLGRELAPLSA